MQEMQGARVRARVTYSSGARARVRVGDQDVDAIVRGEHPVAGDWARGRWIDPATLLIEELEPGRSQIARRGAGRAREEQVLAANVDLAFIVCGLDGDFEPRRIERYQAIAYEGGVEPVVILNKVDQCAAIQDALSRVRDAHAISARTGEGCEVFERRLTPGLTAVLLGSSGAGKSTILNRLLASARQRTSEVRDSDSRGRHTTTHRELFYLANGAAIIDSPGLREIQLLAGEDAIDAVFEDIAALASQCRFADCSHISEPGCAVRGMVPRERIASFVKLGREAARLRGELSEKQRWRSIHKAQKRLYRDRDR